MPKYRTFEELVGEELDRLYRGALFLMEGRVNEAERLLTNAVLEASCAYEGSWSEPAQQRLWLDQCLAESFLARSRLEGGLYDRREGASDPATAVPISRSPGRDKAHALQSASLDSLDISMLGRAAGRLLAGHRIALWLSLIERRTYAEIADMLGRSRADIATWIREGHAALEDALRRDSGKRSGIRQSGRAHDL